MGIRYERDRAKPTNGTVIYFSIYRDEAFQEDLRGAFYTGLSFYAYREPGSEMISFGSSESFMEGIGIPGFVIGLFSPRLPFITIPYKGTKATGFRESFYTMPSASTSFSEYQKEVTQIISDIEGGKCEKVVAARVMVENTSLDIADKFYDLCERFPEAYIFCFGTPATGCWIGASPELLLQGKEGSLESMALAGTRPAGSSGEWDAKNIEEQKYVEEYICDTFLSQGLEVYTGNTFTKNAGKIEHICTPVYAEKGVGSFHLESLLKTLSPTPALCGTPKAEALHAIESLENFDRGCYGGFCGPYRSEGDFTFNVVLRCASVAKDSFCVYVGGGITGRSEVQTEWKETELKSLSFMNSHNFGS